MRLFILLLCSLLGFTACKKEITSYPSISLESINFVSSTSLNVKLNVNELGDFGVVEYGVIYSFINNFDENSGTKVAFGKIPEKGLKEHVVQNIYVSSNYYSTTIFLKPYIKDSKGIVYGNTLQAELLKPQANNITPIFGKVGDRIKILGNFYDPKLESTVVTFNNVAGKVVSVSNTEIVVEVPHGITAVHNQTAYMNVTVGGLPTVSNFNFRMQANITDFSPKSGVIGTKITFIGDNLPDSYYYYNDDLKVIVNDKVVSNQIHNFYMPTSTNFEPKVSIFLNSVIKELGTFNILKPTITSISASEVFPNEQITIMGTNLPSASGYYPVTKVKLGNGSYFDMYRNSNSYYFNVPHDTKVGEYAISMKIDSYEFDAPTKIKVKDISVSSFSPMSGKPGDEIRIKGDFKKGVYYHIYFGSIYTNGTATSDDELVVQVPRGVNPGKVKVKIQGYGFDHYLPEDLTIVSASFISFSPIAAFPGDIITITGKDFSRSDIAVKFGTTIVYPFEVSSTQMKVYVPSGILHGGMRLSVISDGQIITHDDIFTVKY